MAEDLQQEKDHPVWVLYDEHRTACLNVKYYSHKLRRLERWGFWLDASVAFAAPTSAVAGLWFFQSSLGHLIWSTMSIAAATAATIKPIAKIPTKIKALEQTVTGYQALLFDLKDLGNKVRTEGAYTKPMQKTFDDAIRKSKHLVQAEPDSSNDKVLLVLFEDEVRLQLPKENFFIPKGVNGNSKS
jgi:hypothetical protein